MIWGYATCSARPCCVPAEGTRRACFWRSSGAVSRHCGTNWGSCTCSKENIRAAATSLRHGFIDNCYVAEIICGTRDPLPITMWHGWSLAGPGCARDYIDLFGELWNRTPGAVEFLRWLNTHPEVMVERAAILKCDEELLWERDFENRRRICDQREMLAQCH